VRAAAKKPVALKQRPEIKKARINMIPAPVTTPLRCRRAPGASNRYLPHMLYVGLRLIRTSRLSLSEVWRLA